MSEAQASDLLKIPSEGGNEEEEEEEVVLSTKDTGASSVSVPDMCSLADSKPSYPVSSTNLSATGVPANLFSENMPMEPPSAPPTIVFSESRVMCTHTRKLRLRHTSGGSISGYR